MHKDDFGNRMKIYEQLATRPTLIPRLPILVRLDGMRFSKLCKKMDKPFDAAMQNTMFTTTRVLVDAFNANMGYTQSDEITLTWYNDNPKSELPWGGRAFKIVSFLASVASVTFRDAYHANFSQSIHPSRGLFDCRVWNVPDKTEGANAFLWREYDATKNSISGAAQAVYSHKTLQGKNGMQMMDMLMEAGINWNDFPYFFKRGVYVRKVERDISFRGEYENPVDKIVPVNMPVFSTVINREEVIYDGAEPQVAA
ncbi:MAG: hypothetical protein DRI65_11390 [Chloroflexota bacterium]|nr:MAG: hypothetical protein DRI65_11390 [Chloroflexota bacterium]